LEERRVKGAGKVWGIVEGARGEPEVVGVTRAPLLSLLMPSFVIAEKVGHETNEVTWDYETWPLVSRPV